MNIVPVVDRVHVHTKINRQVKSAIGLAARKFNVPENAIINSVLATGLNVTMHAAKKTKAVKKVTKKVTKKIVRKAKKK